MLKYSDISQNSDGSILFGKEYMNNSQHTIQSGFNSSVMSKDHYAKMDPNGECLTSRSNRDFNDDSGFDLDKDTLDLIRPSDLGRKSISAGKGGANPFAHEDEKKLDIDDDEWEKFLEEARKDPRGVDEDDLQVKAESRLTDKDKYEYYRRLITPDIITLTEKKQDAVAPSLYSHNVNENQMISEKDIDATNFNKNVAEILNIEIILLLLSRTKLHTDLTSDLEIARWKKFLMKFLKKNGGNHEALFGMSQINFSIGMHEVAVDFVKMAIETSKGKVPQYSLWKSIYLYFIYLNYKKKDIKSQKTSKYFLT
jgi:hypothetical protein